MQALLSRADRESKLLYFWSQIFENSSPCRLDFVLGGSCRAANLCLVADFHPASQQALYDSVKLALIVVVLQCEPAPLLQSNNEKLANSFKQTAVRFGSMARNCSASSSFHWRGGAVTSLGCRQQAPIPCEVT